MPVYLIEINGSKRLVEARNKQSAMSYVAADTMPVSVPTTAEALRLGVPIESAKTKTGQDKS